MGYYVEILLQLVWLVLFWKRKAFEYFPPQIKKGNTSTHLELLLIVPTSTAAKPSAYPFSSASEMTGSFQTELGDAFFQCRCMLVLLCPVKYIILKSPTGHLFAKMFLAILHPSCTEIECAQRSKFILRCFLWWALTKGLKSMETGRDPKRGTRGECQTPPGAASEMIGLAVL